MEHNPNTIKIHEETFSWNNQNLKQIFYTSKDYLNLSPITHIHAICFLNENEIVIYKDRKGKFGHPGGGLEIGETMEQALRRELQEEIQAKLIKFEVFGFDYFFCTDKSTKYKPHYALWAAAKVELIDKPINDPDGDILERVIIDKSEILNFVNMKYLNEIAEKVFENIK